MSSDDSVDVARCNDSLTGHNLFFRFVFLLLRFPLCQPGLGFAFSVGEVCFREAKFGGKGLGVVLGAAGEIAAAAGRVGVTGILARGQGGMSVGLKEQGIAFGPGIATIAGQAEGFLRVIGGPGRAVGFGLEQPSPAADHKGVGVNEPHSTGSGQGEGLAGAAESVRRVLPRQGDLAGGDMEAGEIEEELAAVEDGLGLAQLGLGVVEPVLGQGTPAEYPVAQGDVVVPSVAFADAEIGLGAARCQGRVTGAEKQFRPVDPATAEQLVGVGIVLLFQLVGKGEVLGGRVKLLA